MLAKTNRVVRPEDFRQVVRRGRRTSTPNAVYYRLDRTPGDPARFGFIVSRAVGSAVERNLVRRRLRAIGRELVDGGASGTDVVVRALPPVASLSWPALSSEVRAVLAPALSGP